MSPELLCENCIYSINSRRADTSMGLCTSDLGPGIIFLSKTASQNFSLQGHQEIADKIHAGVYTCAGQEKSTPQP